MVQLSMACSFPVHAYSEIFKRPYGRGRIGQISIHTCLLALAFCLIVIPGRSVSGETTDTPLAGEPHQTEIFGQEIHVPPRDRRHVTAINFGMNWIPDGPKRLELLPFGALFVWRNWKDENQRFRGTFSGVFNDIQYQRGLSSTSPWFAAMTFENVIIPFGRYEYVEGEAIKDVELEWNYFFAGIGIGYRTPLSPGAG